MLSGIPSSPPKLERKVAAMQGSSFQCPGNEAASTEEPQRKAEILQCYPAPVRCLKLASFQASAK